MRVYLLVLSVNIYCYRIVNKNVSEGKGLHSYIPIVLSINHNIFLYILITTLADTPNEYR